MKRAGTAALIGTAAALGAVILAQEGRKVTGVVESARTRQPVVNAEVRYEEPGLETQTTRTDSKGRFEILNGTQGIATVIATGYATSKRGWPPREGRELRFALTAPSTVMGRLVDAGTLRGIEGRVTLLVRPRFHHVSVSARAPGVFRFDDLPAGPAVIYAHASGFAPYFGELTVDGGKVHERQLGLLLEAVASGKVLNSDDSAAVGANVHVGYDSSLAGADTLAGLCPRPREDRFGGRVQDRRPSARCAHRAPSRA